MSDQNENKDKDHKPSYYYSYGPYKAGQPEETPQSYITDETDNRIEVIDSEAAAYSANQYQQDPIHSSQKSAKGAWQVVEPRRRTSFRAIFASFLAGVVVVGALMYMADTRDWFTGIGNAPANTSSSSVPGTTVSAPNNGTSSSALVERPNDIAELFETASPAVIKIETYVKSNNRSNSGSIFDSPYFRQFFGEGYPGITAPEDGPGNMVPSGIGTGFFFDSTGYILTNQHVIGESDEIKVTVQGYDEPFTAELLGSSYDLDLAVLKITGDKEFPTLPLGSSDQINIGDWVVAIGNPYGFDHTITVGVLSAKERPIDIQDSQGVRKYKHLLQTDASINPGNSGGPLLNLNGEVVGINTAVSSQAQGIGFAIPTSTIVEVLDELKNNEEIPLPPAPFIGADLSNVTEEIAKQLGLDKTEGSIVRNVYYNSPAHQAELQQFDVIVGINGKKYANIQALIEQIQSKKVGESIELNIIRKGVKLDLTVIIGDKNKFGLE